MLRHLFIFTAVFLGGCATDIPKQISEPLPSAPEFNEVQRDIGGYDQNLIRWGGVILELQERQTDSLLEISARELNSWGEPLNNDQSPGRFKARFDAQLDESIYRKGRRITVYGRLEVAPAEMPTGAQMPVVHVENQYLWPEYNNYYDYSRDPYYDFDPYYRLPYPFRYRSRYMHSPLRYDSLYRYGYYPLRYRHPTYDLFRYGYPR
jgi:outer membrane lipoprotein